VAVGIEAGRDPQGITRELALVAILGTDGEELLPIE